MIANHVHDALGQVRRLRELILDKRRFRGYSGPARMISGSVALAGAFVISCLAKPDSGPRFHLAGWAAVLMAALGMNYGALLLWFWRDPEARRDPKNLRPAFEALPPLAVGAFLSLAAVLHGHFDLLFGIWMCVYGLVHIPYRHTLPVANYFVGIFYVLAGAVCLFWPGLTFANPWPMGIVFFTGEWWGGYILYRMKIEEPAG